MRRSMKFNSAMSDGLHIKVADMTRIVLKCATIVTRRSAMKGAAVLNESKYGVSQMGDTIALTLLRAAKSPDFHADQGKHHFAYSYYI